MSVFVSTRAAQKRVPWKTATTCCSARLYLKRNQGGFLSSFLFFFFKVKSWRKVSVLLLEKYRDYNQSIPFFPERSTRMCPPNNKTSIGIFRFRKNNLYSESVKRLYIYMYIKTDTITDFVSFYFLFFFFSSPPFFLFW